MTKMLNKGLASLDWVGLLLGLLALRLLLGWEYFESGLEKLRGENWFGDIQDRFPFPFDSVPPEISWQMATWFELAGGIALAIGLGTRFFAASLFILTIVATAAVHWPAHLSIEWANLAELWQGYAITDRGYGNFKLPFLFMAMLLPLILSGPGRLSVDALLRRLMLRA